MILFHTEKGIAALRYEDIDSVFDVTEKGLRVINFRQNGESMELWTTEELTSLVARIEVEGE